MPKPTDVQQALAAGSAQTNIPRNRLISHLRRRYGRGSYKDLTAVQTQDAIFWLRRIAAGFDSPADRRARRRRLAAT